MNRFVAVLLLAGAAYAGLADDCARALRRKEPGERRAGLRLTWGRVAEADEKERNKAARGLAKGLKDEPATQVRVAIFDLLLRLRTGRSFDRLVVGILDPHMGVRKHVRGIVRDHADPMLHKTIVRTLKEDASWRMRAAMVDLLLAGGRRNAIIPLIVALTDQHPGVKSRAAEALERLTGQTHGIDGDAWIEYLAKSRKPDKTTADSETVTVAGSTRKVKLYEGPIRGVIPTLYTIPITAKRVIFVVDMSNSMRSGKRSAHFDEIKRAIFGLPSDVHFNILCFDQRMFFFAKAKSLQPATTEQKANAERWINDLPAGEKTDVTRSIVSGLAMLKEALDRDPSVEAELFILTDGRETVQSMPAKRVRAHFDRLPQNRCRVHVVVLGRKGTPALKSLAEESGGRLVEQGR
jgi:hypothetical protein